MSTILESIDSSAALASFFATVGASLTIILLGAIARTLNIQKQKVFAATVMASWAVRQLQSEAFLKEKTITPHIVATKRIMEGDEELLENLMLADEFDILTVGDIPIGSIPDDYLLAVGFSNLRLVQVYQAAQGIASHDYDRSSMNEFVKNNLKDYLSFRKLSAEEQNSVLNTYWDYLDRLSRNADRMMVLLLGTLIPEINSYIKKRQFLLFSTREAKEWVSKVESILDQHSEDIPNVDEYYTWLKDCGISKLL